MYYFVFSIFILMLWSSCNKKAPLSSKKIKTTFDSLLLVTNTLQKKAFDSEKIKIESADMLLEEVALITQYDIVYYNNFRTYLDSMKISLYDKNSFSNQETLNQYDKYTAKTIQALHQLAGSIKELEGHKRLLLLYKEVMEADVKDFHLRKDYNISAESFNKFVKENKEKLKSMEKKILPYFNYYYGDVIETQ